MNLLDLPPLAGKLPGFDEMIQRLQANNKQPDCVELEGLPGVSKGFALAHLYARLKRPILFITYQQEQGQRLWNDLLRFGVPSERVAVLPSVRSLFLQGDITDHRLIGERLSALSLLKSGEPCVVIAVVEAVLQRTSAPASLSQGFTLEVGRTISLDDTLKKLVELGYVSALTVTQPGEFSRRGGILDVFSGTSEAPARIELFGDDIESIRLFDVASQRSISRKAGVDISPAREVSLEPQRVERAIEAIRARLKQRCSELKAEKNIQAANRLTDLVENDISQLDQMIYFDGLEQYQHYLFPEPFCGIDYLPAGGVVVVDEPHQIRQRWERISSDMLSIRERHWQHGELLDQKLISIEYDQLLVRIKERSALLLSLLGKEEEDYSPSFRLSIQSTPIETYRGRLPQLADDIGIWLSNQCQIVLVSDQPHRVREICSELKLPVRPRDEKPGHSGLHIVDGRLRAGFKLSDIRFYLLTDAELFGAARPVPQRRKVAGGVAISSVLDLRENDYVVHIQHGIGIYRGLVRRKSADTERDFLLIEYQAGDKLYVAADQIDRVQRYVGADNSPPQINRIGGADWQRTTRKAREQAREMAGELIRLYAARQAAKRPSFGPDSPWQIEMEEAFPYEETPGQLRAVQDVKADLENDQPMDRLICGDVGFGKTEVAIRAAFKVVTEGKQVAILCPTTVLAAQHHSTFSERLAAYPITIDLLSRFRSRKEQLKTVDRMKHGSVDIVVATHRLFSKDVEFKNLGLLIVDEEQRFGVAQKERIKRLKASVDVLTLSATPIPRTLSMALSGLRDMSLVQDPPEGRVPILTIVREYDEGLVRDAIMRELERDGQIFYVHNRIESIYHVAERLRKLIPDLRIEIGHGQMSEDELERVMFDFYHHKADLLLCTTIIENGLDIPNCNTILVDNSDHMGLAQLYQLRGRVGRSDRQAYAYLLYRRNKQLTEIAEQRLFALREFSGLGSGYQLAMKDLEIRGAGNLLGAQQSGAMLSVGFDLYCRLLAQAVQEEQGEDVTEDTLPSVDLPVTAYIPQEYIPGEAERIYFYKKMSGVRTVEGVEDLQAEIEDRYGDPPKPVWESLGIILLRLRCRAIGITSIKNDHADIQIRFAPQVRLTPDSIRLLTYAYKKSRFTSDGVVIPLMNPQVIVQVEEMLNTLEQALQHSKKQGVGARK